MVDVTATIIAIVIIMPLLRGGTNLSRCLKRRGLSLSRISFSLPLSLSAFLAVSKNGLRPRCNIDNNLLSAMSRRVCVSKRDIEESTRNYQRQLCSKLGITIVCKNVAEKNLSIPS